MLSPLGCFEFKLSPAGSPALACHPFGGGRPFLRLESTGY